jgi:hypothetical protein
VAATGQLDSAERVSEVLLNNLTHNEVKWCWEEAQETAFQELKRLLITAPVMALPDLSKKFYLDSDWSRTGIGWTLNQEGLDGHLKPILQSLA